MRLALSHLQFPTMTSHVPPSVISSLAFHDVPNIANKPIPIALEPGAVTCKEMIADKWSARFPGLLSTILRPSRLSEYPKSAAYHT
jgi:hypothetical protein